MPKTTRFEIRDTRPEAGYVLTPEQVKETMPAEYNAFMQQLGNLQDFRLDYPALKATGRTFAEDHRLVKVRFFKVHPTKDSTCISLDRLDPSCAIAEIDSKARYIGTRPAFSYAMLRSRFNHVLVWASALDVKAVEATGWDNVRDNGQFVMGESYALLRKALHRQPVPETPTISNDASHEALVTWKRTPTTSSGSTVIGVAWSAVMVCVHCKMVATVETAGCYKMCKRCRDSVGVPVWYCSSECQQNNYAEHRLVCKTASAAAVIQARCVKAASSGDGRALCLNCGVAPTKTTVRFFIPCLRCKRSGASVLYCSGECQRAHYPAHVEECKQRMYGNAQVVQQLMGVMKVVEETGRDSLGEKEMKLYTDLTSNPFRPGGRTAREYTASLLSEIVDKYLTLDGLAAAAAAVKMLDELDSRVETQGAAASSPP